jgi:hypothetical protein
VSFQVLSVEVADEDCSCLVVGKLVGSGSSYTKRTVCAGDNNNFALSSTDGLVNGLQGFLELNDCGLTAQQS